VVVIDTEQDQGDVGSSRTYADQFKFDIIEWDPASFDVRDLTATLRGLHDILGRGDVIMIDGIAPFWKGPGGILDMVDGVFQSWRNVRPFQHAMTEAMKRLKCHLVLTCRAATDWRMEEFIDSNDKAKSRVAMEGYKPQFDGDIAYEMSLAAHIEQDSHQVRVIKSRSTLLADRVFPPNGGELTLAEEYQAWLEAGKPQITKAQADELVGLFTEIDNAESRRVAKLDFVSSFGAPGGVLLEDWDRALAWAEERIAIEAGSAN
jgi:hypothetical protein